MPTIAPYGSWKSPITPDLIVQDSVGFGPVQLDGDDVYWVEMRPDEGARNVIVRRTPDGSTSDVNPPPFNVRTRVHEYGGLCFWVSDSVVLFVNYSDQRVYRQEPCEPAHSHHAGRGRSPVRRRHDRYPSQSPCLRQRRPS